MKILQIQPSFGLLAGAERMGEALVLALHRLGHQVVVVSLFDERSVITEGLEAEGIKVIYLGKKPGLDLSMFGKLIRVFRQEQPDVIHTHRYICEYVTPAAIIAKVRARVHTVHNVAEKERMHKKLQRFFYHHCGVIPVALSPVVKDSVLEFYRLPEDRVPMIYNGVAVETIPSKTDYRKQGTLRFIHVGRFFPQKNHDNIVEAFARLHRVYPDTSLTLVGTGDLRDWVRDRVRELELDEAVCLPGQLDDVVSQYCQHDVFLLPSRYEGLPIALIEAMGAGMPVVVTPVGGVADMISHEKNGLLCTTEADSIFEAMERMYLDGDLRQRLGQQALVDSERFSSRQMATAYLQVYEQAIRGK